MNNVSASFNNITGQMTEMPQGKITQHDTHDRRIHAKLFFAARRGFPQFMRPVVINRFPPLAEIIKEQYHVRLCFACQRFYGIHQFFYSSDLSDIFLKIAWR